MILPLYNTEIHYIARADSPLNYLHDIKDAKINGGLVGSGAALIAHTLYRMMFNQPIPEANASYLSNEDALVKLVSDKTVDVVVVAAGQPAPLIANMKPEAQKFIKLLRFDPNHPSSQRPLTTYSAATVRATSYPNLLKDNFTTIAVGAFLVTCDYNLKGTVSNLVNFAESCASTSPSCRRRVIRSGAKSTSHSRSLAPAGFTTRRPCARSEVPGGAEEMVSPCRAYFVLGRGKDHRALHLIAFTRRHACRSRITRPHFCTSLFR